MNSVCVRDIVEIVGGEVRLGSLPPLDGEMQPVDRIVTDCRHVRPGDVFWAASNSGNHGADFAELAFSRGATGVVVSGRRVEPWAGKFCIQVGDTDEALRRLGAWARDMFGGSLILVANPTGEAGLRKEIDAVLRRDFNGKSLRAASHAPSDLAIAMLQLSFRQNYGILEVDVNSSTRLAEVAAACSPDIVVLPAGRGPVPGYRLASKVLKQLLQQTRQPTNVVIPEGLCVSLSPDGLQDLSELCVTVGPSASSELRALHVRTSGDSLMFVVDGHTFRLPGRTERDLDRTLIALAVGRLLGISLAPMEEALVDASSDRVPFALHEKRGVALLHVTQSADRRSVELALEQFRDREVSGRRIVVCADLPVPASATAGWHREVGEAIVRISEADLLVACGNSSHDLVVGARDAGMPLSRAIACRHPDEALPIIDASVVHGDVLLLQDSCDNQLQCIVDAVFERSSSLMLETASLDMSAASVVGSVGSDKI